MNIPEYLIKLKERVEGFRLNSEKARKLKDGFNEVRWEAKITEVQLIMFEIERLEEAEDERNPQ